MATKTLPHQADTIREDGRLERTCTHGVGHTVGHIRGHLKDKWESVHGCDGCCWNYSRMHTRASKERTHADDQEDW